MSADSLVRSASRDVTVGLALTVGPLAASVSVGNVAALALYLAVAALAVAGLDFHRPQLEFGWANRVTLLRAVMTCALAGAAIDGELGVRGMWIATAIVSAFVYPVADSHALLARTGIPAELRPLMLYGAAGFDLLLGLGILFMKRRRWLWLAQLGLIGFYTVVIAWKLPEFLVHPYGPLTKNLPMLAAIWLLYQLEDEEK